MVLTYHINEKTTLRRLSLDKLNCNQEKYDTPSVTFSKNTNMTSINTRYNSSTDT